ncbi:hypothetical protein [Carboxylicivirga sp. M1479]|nr:hypothetical protein [Carboxylicivirga sp. M1479]
MRLNQWSFVALKMVEKAIRNVEFSEVYQGTDTKNIILLMGVAIY